mmetsp:Transcript_30564/g.72103  ORF Transcript_30564/g.72103 Transcript_30564/m.72103 type:complete len:233 (+) Transcript_30564:467-1165(+)
MTLGPFFFFGPRSGRFGGSSLTSRDSASLAMCSGRTTFFPLTSASKTSSWLSCVRRVLSPSTSASSSSRLGHFSSSSIVTSSDPVSRSTSSRALRSRSFAFPVFLWHRTVSRETSFRRPPRFQVRSRSTATSSSSSTVAHRHSPRVPGSSGFVDTAAGEREGERDSDESSHDDETETLGVVRPERGRTSIADRDLAVDDENAAALPKADARAMEIIATNSNRLFLLFFLLDR